MGISFEDTLNLAKRYFDVGGSFDQTMKDAWTRQATYVQIFTDAINHAMNGLTTLTSQAGRIGGRSRMPTFPTNQTPFPHYAHGTDQVVSSPTPFMAGERGAERVIVQPLSPIGVGGNVSMSWHGGPIPIHGTGAMDNIDTSAIGNAIAQGLVQEMARSFSSIRGTRGR